MHKVLSKNIPCKPQNTPCWLQCTPCRPQDIKTSICNTWGVGWIWVFNHLGITDFGFNIPWASVLLVLKSIYICYVNLYIKCIHYTITTLLYISINLHLTLNQLCKVSIFLDEYYNFYNYKSYEVTKFLLN